jgi:gas vesicle protein
MPRRGFGFSVRVGVKFLDMEGGSVMSNRTTDFLTGLLIGGLIGAALGVLYAPKSGKETREDIGRKSEEWMAKAKEEYDAAVERSKKIYDATVSRLRSIEEAAKEKAGDLEGKVSELAAQGKASLQENTGRLKRAIDAGVEAYKEEKEKTA